MKAQIYLLVLFASIALSACAPQSKLSMDQSSTSGDVNTPSDDSELGTDDPVIENPVTPVEAYAEDSRKFNRAWTRTDTQIIIDAYSGNSINWDQMATDKRVVGVIHRSSIGMTVDTQYKARQAIAESRGYLWGAYHLGRPGDPIDQAKLFLKTIGNPDKVLMILDLEDTSSGSFMNSSNARKFLDYVYKQTGKMPVVYANHSVTKSLSSSYKNDPLFAETRLWYARFRSDIPDFPSTLWPTYFLWQFSSEINCSSTGSCLYNVPGTRYDMDINIFYGSKEALAYQWSL